MEKDYYSDDDKKFDKYILYFILIMGVVSIITSFLVNC